MARSVKSLFRQPWLWASLALLSGVEFFTVNTAPFNTNERHQAQRVPAAAEPKVQAASTTTSASADGRLIILSWDVKALAKANADLDRAALVLADADLIVLQNIETGGTGKGFLNMIAGLIEDKTKSKFCYAWTQNAEGLRLSYGFMWRESHVGYLDGAGLMHEDCSPTTLSIRQERGLHGGAHASFYSKHPRRVFELATAAFDKRPKSAAQITEIFRAVNERQWPVLVAADFKMGGGDPWLGMVSQAGYQTALDASKRSGQASHVNVWYRNGELASSGTIDLFERFGDSRREDVEQGLGDLFPVAVELKILSDGHEELTSTLISKSHKAPPPTAKKKKVAVKKVEKPRRKVAHAKAKPPTNDLEDEAGSADKVVDEN